MGVKISQLPTVPAATLADLIAAVQNGVTSQETLAQVLALVQSNIAVKGPVIAATTGPLTATYNNGASGVGATLTNAFTLAPLVIDGVTVIAGQRVLINNQAAPAQNGIYLVTAPGTIFTPWVLTRATDFNSSTTISQGSQIAVSEGSTNAGTIWIETDPGPFVVGTTAILFSVVRANLAAPSDSSVLVTTASAVPVYVGPLTNGQLIIGSTGATPVAAALTAGPGVSIANGAGTITISGTGSGIGWTNVTSTTLTMVADNGYVIDSASLCTATLPTTAALGQAISIIGLTGGWQVAQNAGQSIIMGSVTSTVGTGGGIASTNIHDSINLICVVANTTFALTGGPQGNITVV